MAKKGRKITKRLKQKKSKHTENLKLVLFLAVIAVAILVLAKTNLKNETFIKAKIKDVTTEQVGDTNTYVFYYTVVNPTNKALECDVVVDISGKPYTNKVSLEPNQELYTMTSVEMPNGESSIQITSACR